MADRAIASSSWPLSPMVYAIAFLAARWRATPLMKRAGIQIALVPWEGDVPGLNNS